MNVYMLLLCFWYTAHAAITYSSFKRVHNVSLSDYEDHVLTVEKNVYNRIECSSKCQTDCLSYSFNKETKECKTYTKPICDGSSVSLSSVINVYRKKSVNPACSLTSCSDVGPGSSSGVYRVAFTPCRCEDVYCDMDTAGGPWTVIQNREVGTTNFYRNWADYQIGFGDLNGEFWAGLDIIHLLTQTGSILRIELVSWTSDARYAQYSDFRVGDESSLYQLSVSGFSGNVLSDAMAYHDSYQFSTYDNDNDVWGGSCALDHHGGWWYKHCAAANLNGRYAQDTGADDDYDSMYWVEFYTGRDAVPMLKSRMLVKHPTV